VGEITLPSCTITTGSPQCGPEPLPSEDGVRLRQDEQRDRADREDRRRDRRVVLRDALLHEITDDEEEHELERGEFTELPRCRIATEPRCTSTGMSAVIVA
jgi:hypothetical protein